MRVLVLIPARGGSKGLPGKNLRTVGGMSLVARAARIGRRFLSALELDGTVVVDTDSAEIASEAVRWGAEAPFLRPPHLATDTTPAIENILHAIERLAAGGRDYDIVVLLQPTSPLREVSDVIAVFKGLGSAAQSCIAIVEPDHPPEQTLRLSQQGTVDWAWPELLPERRRQELPTGYRPSGSVYVATTSALRERRTFFIPGQTRGVPIPRERSVDVDTLHDLIAAEALLENRAAACLRIGARSVGPGEPCYVIAEAGVNHNGSVELAHKLVDVAADAGADAVKFQTFDPLRLVSPSAAMADYQVRNTKSQRTQAEMLSELVLPREAHRELMQHAAARGIQFLSSAFDEGSADFLFELGVPAFKLGSGELTNHPLLAHIAAMGRPILVSTGMADLTEVHDSVDVIRENGAPPLALFHCVTSYPAAIADSNLRAMKTLRSCFGCPVGWSDHTEGIAVAIAAAAMGASLIEKHFTLDKNLPGPDHKASLTADELSAMTRAIRSVEHAQGDGVKVPRPLELPLRVPARKSLHAARNLPAGHVLSAASLIALRPGNGIAPSRLQELVGRVLARAVAEGQQIAEEDLG